MSVLVLPQVLRQRKSPSTVFAGKSLEARVDDGVAVEGELGAEFAFAALVRTHEEAIFSQRAFHC